MSADNNSLRFLAKQAKSRLRGCKNNNEISNYRGYDNATMVYDNTYEKMIYAKVAQIIESDEEVLNPLQRIVDSNLIANSDDATRQKIMLEASKLFIKLKKKYLDTVSNLG